MAETKDIREGLQFTRAAVVQNSYNEETGTFDITFATETPVLRYDWDENYNEVLVCSSDNVRSARLNAGLPLLNSHPMYGDANRVMPENVMGKISNCRFENRTLIGTVTLGAQCSPETRADLQNGILDTFSVGYSRYKGTREENNITGEVTVKITDWEPNHVAIAPIPADINSQMRADEAKSNFIIDNYSPKTTGTLKTIEEIRANANDEQKARLDAIVGICRAAQQTDEKAIELFESEKTLDVIAKEVISTPDVDVDAVRAQATQSQKAFLNSILASTRAAKMDDAKAIEFYNSGKSIEEIRQAIIEDFQKADPKTTVNMGADKTEAKVRAIENAMLHRVAPTVFKLEDGNEFRGMTLMEIGKELLQDAGVNVRGKDKQEVSNMILKGQRDLSTSDFPLLLENVLNKSLRADYQLAEEYWDKIARETSVNDFKVKSMYQLDSANGMKELPEGDEIKYTKMTEAKQTIKVKTYAEGLILTRQMIVNDDLSAFERIPQKFVTDWNLLRGDLVWGMITSNVKMDDGKALFHADHANIAGTAAVLTEASLTAAVLALKKQTSISGKTLRIVPKYLIVSPDQEIAARKLLATVAPTQTSQVNVFSSMNIMLIVEHRLTGNAWYLTADPASIEGLYYAYLQGNGGLRSNREESFDTNGVKFSVTGEFGVAAIDHRGWFKNAGV